jgi:1-acyl-sn-glycerol-3-phosphate acyltransferase
MKKWKIEPAHDLGMPMSESLKDLQRENGLISTALHLVWWGFVRVYLRLWHRFRVYGRRHIPPSPPYILVANHASHLDALVLASPLPFRQRDHIFPIAAGDVFFETPLVSGFAAGMLNALPMWRKKCGRHHLQQLRDRLVQEPCAYILFPEGTRSRDGEMVPFKPGLGMIVAGTDVPIVPCYLQGCHEALQPGQKWPRPKPLALYIGEPLRFPDAHNTKEGWIQVAEQSEAAVRALQSAVDQHL